MSVPAAAQQVEHPLDPLSYQEFGPTREIRSPIRIDQPLGPGFRIQGHVVEWQTWRFHVRLDQRVGTVVSTVTYNDGERRQVRYYHRNELYRCCVLPALAFVEADADDRKQEQLAEGLGGTTADGLRSSCSQSVAPDYCGPSIEPASFGTADQVRGSCIASGRQLVL